jgi:hypothetical protein
VKIFQVEPQSQPSRLCQNILLGKAGLYPQEMSCGNLIFAELLSGQGATGFFGGILFLDSHGAAS